jgi:predicted SAM-dependent methyltransferase
MKLNLGCGPIQPPGWINVDGSNRAWLASRLPWLDRALVAAGLAESTEFGRETVHVNLLRRFPWRDHSVDAIYMGEILEHFKRQDGEDREVSFEFACLITPGSGRVT